jgi:hypothetical protein
MDTPQVLLEHYLKHLRLPTMLREYPKLAEQCAKEATTFEQFLLRWSSRRCWTGTDAQSRGGLKPRSFQ